MNKFKIVYLISLLFTALSTGVISYGLHTGNLIQVIYALPIFALFYPLALMFTAGYMVKHTLQNKNLFDLMSMASGSDSGDGLGMLKGIASEDGEEEEEADSQ